MPIVKMSLGEALEKGYQVVGAQQAQREDATFSESAISIGLEVVPALLGGIMGGPAGGAGGAGIGNYLSQRYRISRGLQDDYGLGELGASMALGAIPVGKLANVGTVGKTAIRGAQGSGMATAELAARTYIDEDRAPTQEELASTILFGGLFGGTLGAVEAKYLNDTLDIDAPEGATRPEVVKLLENKIDEAGGMDNFAVGRPTVTALGPRRLRVWNPKELEGPNAETPGELLLGGIEGQLLLEAESAVNKAARVKGEEVTEQMATLQQIFEGKDLADNQIFKGINTTINKGIQRVGDNTELNSLKERIAVLDHKLGKGQGAKKERARIEGAMRRVYKRNGLNLLDLQDDMRASQMAPNDPPKLTGKDRPPTKADPMTKEERLAEKYFGQGYEKFFGGAVSTGAVGAAMLSEEDEDEMKRAGFSPEMILVLIAAGLGAKGFSKFRKTKSFKQMNAQGRANPKQAEPTQFKEQRMANNMERNAFAGPTNAEKIKEDAKGIISNMLEPLSRKLKKIDVSLARVFRDHDMQVAVKTREYMDKVTPFLRSVTPRLKNSPELQRKFKQYLLNGEYTKISDEILPSIKAPEAIFKQMSDMRSTLDELRDYARERGGIDVGYIASYFPRQIKDYKKFRKALDEKLGNTQTKNQIDQALDEYAKKHGYDNADLIPPEEAGEVVSRVLRGYPVQPGQMPANAKMRKIEEVNEEFLDAYADPGDALTQYVERMVQATERRNFLFRKPNVSQEVGFQGSRDRTGGDLGMSMDMDDGVVGAVARRLGTENNLSADDVDALRKIIKARFSGQSVSNAAQVVKNANYIATMGNFGSAITQLGDLAYSIHFNGFGETFRSLFNRKDNYDFVKHFGLSDHNIDTITTTGGLSKALDKVFTVTGLKKLDQLSKNTTMNASWKKYKAQAMKNSKQLQDELTPVFGAERAGQMVKELRESNPGSKNLPKGVEELIWYKFLDLNPASLTEMPLYYNAAGNMRIAYMLKSFTIKQFDVFREAAGKDIAEAKLKMQKGDKQGAARSAAQGIYKLTSLGLIFGAANASTDVIKDTMYGRPTDMDDLLADNALKLLGINRYLAYKARREGVGKAVMEMALPPMTVIDRLGKDLDNLFQGKDYKGNMLQGTPLDIIYWQYLGGLDKTQRAK